MWLSFIIPLYNCEPYIKKCLDSLLNQGLEINEYEIIVVNDGSTDQGATIVSKYENKYPNIHLLNQENQGVSSARNRGIEGSHGDYIQFIDADDYLLPNAMSFIKKEIFDNGLSPDILFYLSKTVDKYYDYKNSEKLTAGKILFSGGMDEYVKYYGLRWFIWGTIYLRNFLIDNNLKFRPFNFCEDLMFMSDLFILNKGNIILISLDAYRYVLRPKSASTSYDVRILQESIKSLCDIYKEVNKLNTISTYSTEIYKKFIYSIRRLAFIRLCSLPPSKMKTYIDLTQSLSLFNYDKFLNNKERLINFVSKNPLFFYLISVPMRYIFLPFIKPYLKRN